MLNVKNLKSGMMKTVLFMFFLLSSSIAFAQNRVSGVVTDSQGEPLIGVTVLEVGTKNGAVTDYDGRYSINVERGKSLQFSYIGYTAKTVRADGSQVNVVLEEDYRIHQTYCRGIAQL